MIDQSLAPGAHPHTRELRALALVKARGHEILRTGPWTYTVPSCTGTGSWAVNYRRETCDCPDFLRRGTVCKHVAMPEEWTGGAGGVNVFEAGAFVRMLEEAPPA